MWNFLPSIKFQANSRTFYDWRHITFLTSSYKWCQSWYIRDFPCSRLGKMSNISDKVKGKSTCTWMGFSYNYSKGLISIIALKFIKLLHDSSSIGKQFLGIYTKSRTKKSKFQKITLFHLYFYHNSWILWQKTQLSDLHNFKN